MPLDIRTMMVMTALLALLLSGLLAVVSLHSENIRGVRCWALAELCIGISLGLAFTQLTPGNGWVLVLGSGLLALGLCFQWAGNRAFCHKQPQWHWVWLAVGMVVVFNILFAVSHPNPNHRVIANSLMLAAISFASAHVLFRHVTPPMRAPFLFTAGAFCVLTCLMLVRAGYVVFHPAEQYGLYSQVTINPVTFFVVSLLQMALVFGFVLMMHYRISHELQSLAARDSLTGALNRRSLKEAFEHLRALYLRSGEVLAVMMIDVDHFKSINDRHGHLVGDDVLRRLVAVIEATIRKQDYLARYGGEEFCILMPATSELEALVIAERLRTVYAGTNMGDEGSPWYSTISIGVTDSVDSSFDFEKLIEVADRALYHAKQTGRNRVVPASSSGM